jgi:hypothetical protein
MDDGMQQGRILHAVYHRPHRIFTQGEAQCPASAPCAPAALTPPARYSYRECGSIRPYLCPAPFRHPGRHRRSAASAGAACGNGRKPRVAHVAPSELRERTSKANSDIFARARIIAPASRRRRTTRASVVAGS